MRTVRKTVYLPPELVREAEALAKSEGKSLSAVVHDVLTERNLERNLRR